MDSSNSIIFICDVQQNFKSVIHGFDHVVNTINKMLKIAKVFGIEVLVTTQYAKALGQTEPSIDLASLGELHIATIDKTLFSMMTPEVEKILQSKPHIKNVILMGIEAHICVLQTALSLLDLGVTPYVLADGTSSTSPHEPPIAHAFLRQRGAVISTSESVSFLLVKDASREGFKAFSNIIKQEKENTTRAQDALLVGSSQIKPAM